MNNERKLTKEDVGALRDRVKYEDDLLNSRTNIVLALNGLMAVAVSMQMPTVARFSITVILIIINSLWLPCAIEAYGFIKKLTVTIKDSDFVPIDEQMRQDYIKRSRVGPTRFMSIIVPSLLLAGWIIALSFSILMKLLELIKALCITAGINHCW